MRLPLFVRLSGSVLCMALGATIAAGSSMAASEKVLYSFTGGADGSSPNGGLITDAAGALYGVGQLGGSAQLGVVFKLTPPAAGQSKWSETVLHAFQGFPRDGSQPLTRLLMDKTGALYGTTLFGGAANSGMVYKLTPPAGGPGPWSQTVVYSFCPGLESCSDGEQPVGLAFGPSGVLYGVTKFGGPTFGGVIFQLTPPAQGQSQWTESVLAGLPEHSEPEAGLISDPAGVLYGTASLGGAHGHGSVYKLTPPPKGKAGWTLTTLWSFGATAADGRFPEGAVSLRSDGALYGTTAIGGGLANAGVVFRLSPPAPGQKLWQEAVLHRFTGPDGAQSMAGVIFDRAGALYGTETAGGSAGQGTVFSLVPAAGGVTWLEKTLHSFRTGTDAAEPGDPLLMLPSGALVSTSFTGGQFGEGAVYQIVP